MKQRAFTSNCSKEPCKPQYCDHYTINHCCCFSLHTGSKAEGGNPWNHLAFPSAQPCRTTLQHPHSVFQLHPKNSSVVLHSFLKILSMWGREENVMDTPKKWLWIPGTNSRLNALLGAGGRKETVRLGDFISRASQTTPNVSLSPILSLIWCQTQGVRYNNKQKWIGNSSGCGSSLVHREDLGESKAYLERTRKWTYQIEVKKLSPQPN